MRFVLDWPPLNAPLGLIEVGLIEVSGRAARNSPPTASAVETAATKNEQEDDDDQKLVLSMVVSWQKPNSAI
jgi:hypothetical protein